jgi:hypothetical protein
MAPSPLLPILCRAVVASAVLTTLSKHFAAYSTAGSAWRTLQLHVVDALQALSADAPANAASACLSLSLPLFAALAAALELNIHAESAGIGTAPEEAASISAEHVRASLQLACTLLMSIATPPVELLRHVRAALRLLQLRGALSSATCASMLAVFPLLLQRSSSSSAGASLPSVRAAVMDAFSTLADTPVQQHQALLVDGLLAAVQDLPALGADDTHWLSFGGTLQLLAALTRALPKTTSIFVGERCLAAALSACAHVSHASATASMLHMEHAATAAVRTLVFLCAISSAPVLAARLTPCVLLSAPGERARHAAHEPQPVPTAWLQRRASAARARCALRKLLPLCRDAGRQQRRRVCGVLRPAGGRPALQVRPRRVCLAFDVTQASQANGTLLYHAHAPDRTSCSDACHSSPTARARWRRRCCSACQHALRATHPRRC